MIPNTQKGFVLKTMDYRENATISYIFTNDGLVSVLVKGTKKMGSKLRPLTIPFTLINFALSGKNELKTLINGEVINNYSVVKDDLEKSIVSSIILEKAYQLGPMNSDYSSLLIFLEKIGELLETTKYPRSVQILFEVKFLYRLGIAFQLTHCPKCHQEIKEGYFSVEYAGILCEDCRTSIDYYSLDKSSTNLLRYLYLIQINKIDENFLNLIAPYLDVLEIVIDEYYSKYLDFVSRSKKIGAKILNKHQNGA